MRKHFCLTLVLLAVSAAALFGEGLAGSYKGSWSGSSGASGDFRITLSSAGEGQWKAEVTFSFSGEDVKTKVTSVDVDGDQVKIVYQFDLQDNKLESTVRGRLNGKTLEGTYNTKAVADGSAVDDGSWKATAE
jgi:hypothetical protein